jgi:hypothetical protein
MARLSEELQEAIVRGDRPVFAAGSLVMYSGLPGDTSNLPLVTFRMPTLRSGVTYNLSAEVMNSGLVQWARLSEPGTERYIDLDVGLGRDLSITSDFVASGSAMHLGFSIYGLPVAPNHNDIGD